MHSSLLWAALICEQKCYILSAMVWRFFCWRPLLFLAMKNLLPCYYVKLQSKICTSLVHFSPLIAYNSLVGNKSLPWGKMLCLAVLQQCKQPFWAANPSTTDVTHKSKFTFCYFSHFPKAKGFFLHIDNVLLVPMCACASICLDMFCVVPIYIEYKCTTAQISHSIHWRSSLCLDSGQKKRLHAPITLYPFSHIRKSFLTPKHMRCSLASSSTPRKNCWNTYNLNWLQMMRNQSEKSTTKQQQV